MSQNIRQTSLLLSVIPWSTDTIIMQDDLASGFSSEKMIPSGLILAAKQTENSVLRSETTLPLLQLQDTDAGNIQTLESKGRSTGFQPLVRLLTIYRVIDVLAWIDGGVAPGSVPRFSKLPRIGRHKTQPLPQIKNWSKVLRDSMLDLLDHNESLSFNLSDLRAGAAFTISRLILHGDLAQRLLNVEVAAMHMAYLIQGNSDLPPKMVDLLDEISLSPLDPTDKARIVKDSPTTQPWRLPLHVALFISPIFLLTPLNLHNRDWDRTSLLQTFRAFGNQKPEALIKYEKLLWKAIYQVALREIDVASAVRGFLDNIQWDDLDKLSMGELHWFETTADHDIWLSPDLNKVRVEGELPVGWPLRLCLQDGLSASSSHSREPPATPDGMDQNREDPSLSNPGDSGSLNQQDTESQPDGEYGTPNGEGTGFREDMERETDDEDEDRGTGGPLAITLLRRGMQDVDLNQSSSSHGDSSSLKRNAEQLEATSNDETVRNTPSASKRQRQNSPALSNISTLTELDEHGDVVMRDEDGTRASSRTRRNKGKGKGKSQSNNEHEEGSPRRKKSKRHTRNTEATKQAAHSPPGRTKLIIEHVLPEYDDGTFDEPIDLTVEDTSLDHLSTPKKYTGKVWVAYGPRGEQHEIQPTMHFEDELSNFEGILSAVEDSYIEGQPLHLADPSTSAFAIYSADEFDELSDFQVQETLRDQHIIITGRKKTDVVFGLPALNELRVLNVVATIQDQSINVSADDLDGNYNRRNLQGTMFQFYACASLPSNTGKILNVLDCPMGDGADLQRNSFTSDLHAWRATKKLPDTGKIKSLPGDDIRWGLAATSGALHWFHIDSDGFGTYIDVQTGGKLWIIARPKVSGGSRKDFSKIKLFLSENFDIAAPSVENWDLEAMYLENGTRFIMRPNTPHCVYTHGNTICHGGHFYATGCLQDTLFSLLHSFVAGNMVTNTEHEPSRLLLRRMVQFYHAALVSGQTTQIGNEASHLPPIHTREGVLDLFSICILTELSNVLSFQTYTPRGMSPADREHSIHARRRSRDLLDWFFSTYELVRPTSGLAINGRKDVYWAYVVQIVRVLLRYKESAEGLVTDSVEGCTTAAVERQIERCFRDNIEYHEAASFWSPEPLESFAWPMHNEKCAFDVRKLSTPKDRPIYNIDGLTADDKLVKSKRIPKIRLQNLDRSTS